MGRGFHRHLAVGGGGAGTPRPPVYMQPAESDALLRALLGAFPLSSVLLYEAVQPDDAFEQGCSGLAEGAVGCTELSHPAAHFFQLLVSDQICKIG